MDYLRGKDMKRLNVNEVVIVKLNETGKVAWQKYASATSNVYKDPVLFDSKYNREMKKLKEDTLETQLWELMKVFGPYMGSEDYPFIGDIKIKEKSLY